MPKIYPSGKKSHPWMVSWRHQGKRDRYYFKTEQAAKEKLDELEKKILVEGAEGVYFDANARAEWRAATNILQPFKVSLIEVAQDYANRHRSVHDSIRWDDAVFQLVESLERANRRPKTIKSTQKRLKLYQEYIGATSLADFTAENVEAFLASGDWKPSTVAGYRVALSSLGNFAMRRKWIAENPVDGIEPPKLDRGNPTVYTVEEANRLLHVAANMRSQYRTGKKLHYDQGRIVRRLCLLLLAGLRPEEVDHLKPENMLPDGIRVSVGKIRGRRSVRIVPMSPQFRAWWDAYPNKFSDFSPPNFRRLYERAKKTAGIEKTGTDLERHTWISCRLAATGDENRTSREAGNSPAVIYSNYFQLMTEAEARQLGAFTPLPGACCSI
ncbi:hypothetical protein DDZ13_06480 [Coraliomargarita sinensis]|uniref:Core-binding (CB) domain-containing protein n=1 Tax=Coraliomargarita sinensis TaxID=2174842 RepID=A0A317ZGU6_9BACT|nr:hypothetical protein [Coraliomargarita sinensis]PXA04806.1 hypothetical protein DDZ13_06480 [Coraliomargarita sinensis]